MSLSVVFRETALRNLARIRGEDKDLFTRTRRAISAATDGTSMILKDLPQPL